MRHEGCHVALVLVDDLLAELIHPRALPVAGHGADHLEVDRPEVDDRRTHFSGREDRETAGEPTVGETHAAEPDVAADGPADDPRNLTFRREEQFVVGGVGADERVPVRSSLTAVIRMRPRSST